jgi:hypothetical protein
LQEFAEFAHSALDCSTRINARRRGGIPRVLPRGGDGFDPPPEPVAEDVGVWWEWRT